MAGLDKLAALKAALLASNYAEAIALVNDVHKHIAALQTPTASAQSGGAEPASSSNKDSKEPKNGSTTPQITGDIASLRLILQEFTGGQDIFSLLIEHMPNIGFEGRKDVVVLLSQITALGDGIPEEPPATGDEPTRFQKYLVGDVDRGYVLGTRGDTIV